MFLGYMVWRVGCPWHEVSEEGLVRRNRLLVFDPSDCFVSQISRQVITFFWCFGRFNWSRILIKNRVPLASAPTKKTVEVFKTQPRGPTIKRASNAFLIRWHIVMLTESCCVVPILFQHFTDSCRISRYNTGVTRVTRSTVTENTGCSRVVISSRE